MAEGAGTGFDNDAGGQGTTPLHLEQFVATAEQVADTASKSPQGVLPCDPQATGEEVCAQRFIETFGRRAYRRPLTDDDRQRLEQVYTLGKGSGGFANGIRLVIQTALLSPHFMYRLELGRPGDAAAGAPVRLTDYELASRLSYFLWSTMPDEPLFKAAAAGRLSTTAEIAAEVDRMLADPRARKTAGHFHRQWLHLEPLDQAEKAAALFPGFTADVGRQMQQGTGRFMEYVLFDSPSGDLNELFTADYAFASAATAPYYGVQTSSTDFQKVALKPDQRAGFLTDAGLMTALAKFEHTDPVIRGLFVREGLLCQTLPSPPDNIPELPKLSPNLTTRELFTQHRKDPACAQCHALMDPIGFGFENYDAVGRHRTTENGKPVDSSGELTATRGLDGPFNGAVELARRLAGGAEVKDCVMTQWFRFAFGREETAADECTMEDLRFKFSDAGNRMRALLTAITQTPAFYYRGVDSTDTGGCTP